MAKIKTKQQLTIENDELLARLQELEDTLEAIRSGAVDAIVTSGPAGDQVFTLEGADHAYHMMVESMNEGAVTILTDGTILYGNRQFGQMTGASPSGIVGRRFHDFVSVSDYPILNAILDKEGLDCPKAELRLGNNPGADMPVQVAASPIELSGAKALTLVITDLSAQRRYEEIVAAENLSRRILEQAQEAIAVCINGCIVRANRAFYEICGSFPLMQPFDLVFPLRMSDAEMFSVASPESGETIRNREVRYRRPDGKIFDLILNAGPLVGKENKVLGSLISLLDITERKRAESVLQSTLQRFYLMLASMYSGVLLMTDEGRVEFVNQAFCDSYGLKEAPNDLTGLASRDLLERIRHAYLHPDQAAARVREILQRGQPVRGEEFAMQGGRTALRDFVPLSVDGKSSGRLWIHVDITERKRAEERLRDSENRFREMAETVPEILFTALPDGSMDYVNERGLDYAGLPAGEAMGNGWMKVVHPQDIEQSVRSVGESLRTGQPYELKQRLRAADGSYRWFLARARAVRDEKGNILKWFGSATDIHDMMQVEEALQASEARFRTLAEEMPHFVWETDADGKVLFANKRFYDFTGLTYEQAKAGGWLAVQHPDDAPAVEAAWLAALKGLGDYDVESRIRNRSTGEYRWYRIKGSPVTDSSGRIIRWVGTCTDINDVKQAEESMRIANESLEQRVRERTMDLQNLAKKLELSRGELRKLASELVMAEERERKRIAGVLHDEIAQTLAAARMRADMIRGIPSDQEERMKETKALLAQSIRETRSLMNDLGTPLLFDMGLQAACESLADRLMRIHPVRIRCDIGDAYKGLDPDVKIILYQLIRELLNNIVKHSQAQNALVAIDTENGMFRVKVTDDGVGFDPEVLGAPTAEGGFGLYSIRERLIAVDGTLRIESAPGAGTTVTAIVPSKMN